MISYAETDVFSPPERAALAHATQIVAVAPNGLSCHDLVEYVRNANVWVGLTRSTFEVLVVNRLRLGLTVCRGHFGAVEHSWFVLRTPPVDVPAWPARTAILDVYVVGSLPQVQLIDPYVPGVTLQYRPL